MYVKYYQKKNYKFCRDFEEQRELLTSDWLGQEQLLSMYIECFYPDYYSKLKENSISLNKNNETKEVAKNKKIKNFVLLLNRIKRKLINPKSLYLYISRKINNLVGKWFVVVGIMESFFPQSQLDDLTKQSCKRILAIPEIPLGKSCEAIMDLRIASFTENDDADGFDRFFFFL